MWALHVGPNMETVAIGRCLWPKPPAWARAPTWRQPPGRCLLAQLVGARHGGCRLVRNGGGFLGLPGRMGSVRMFFLVEVMIGPV